MNMIKACGAIIALVIGMVLLFEGAYPTIGGYADGIYIVVGAALVLSYFPLIGDFFELKFRAQRGVICMPVLLVLGLLMLYYGATRAGLATLALRSTFIIPGVVLVIVSLILFSRNIRTSSVHPNGSQVLVAGDP
ncbi:hypothetical protein ES703_03824 [subsurface metagenome]